MSDVPPGRCGVPAPGHMQPYWCELLAGHAGMHQANDWSANTEGHLGSPFVIAWTTDGEDRDPDARLARIRALCDEAGRLVGEPAAWLLADRIRTILDAPS